MKYSLAAALVACSVATSSMTAVAGTSRQMQVERSSERVMPFSMDATMHHFDLTSTGGIQTVLVHNGDSTQVGLVRSHLRKEVVKFSHGIFNDPASIHGRGMPGLNAMRAGAARITVRYIEVPNGGKISYGTPDPALVSAIHAWFRAQVNDHGPHATMKM